MTTRIMLTRQGLADLIEASHDAHIAERKKAMTNAESPEHWLATLEAWRADAKKRVLDLAKRIRNGSVEDAELADFRLRDCPDHPDKWSGLRDKHQQVTLAEAAKRRATRRFEALSWPDDPKAERSFTTTQLRELFEAGCV